MSKYSFLNDYAEGAHPHILEALIRANLQQESGYGLDAFSQEASQLIQKKINNRDAAIHFVTGGTQANLLCIASFLKPYESIIAADSGHITVHEAGAIEATGHKINLVPAVAGKVTLEGILKTLDLHMNEHMVRPGAVYLSQSTELGTIYSKEELQKISQCCQEKDLFLFIDGARLGQALTATKADLTLEDYAKYCDVFTIGGTKNGALLGEAIVILHSDLQKNFRYHLKQRGALLAKGRILGIQFLEFFKSDALLYFKNGEHANEMAGLLAAGIQAAGYSFFQEPQTNQLFPILPNSLIKQLQQYYEFYVWSPAPGKSDCSIVRLVTSWATQEDAVRAFLKHC